MCWHMIHPQKDSTLVGKPYTTSTMLQGRPLQQSRLSIANCHRADQECVPSAFLHGLSPTPLSYAANAPFHANQTTRGLHK